MQSALQPHATAGVAIVGASLIAVTPAVAPLPESPPALRDVALAAGESTLGDFLNPFIDQYNTAVTNADQVFNNFYLAPGVGLQQAMVNQSNFLQEVLSDPSKITQVSTEMQDNLQTVLKSLTLIGTDKAFRSDVVPLTMANEQSLDSHQFVYSTLFGFIPADQPLLTLANEFLGSPLSGVLIGELGPFLAPFVALGNSISDGDSFSEILANTVGAFFNGATLNLDEAIPLVVSSGLLVLPPATTVDHLSLALGGLFSTGDVSHDPWEIYDSDGNVFASVPPVGGSMFNSLGLTLDSGPLHIDVPGHAVGPFAALQGLSELIGLQLGDNWNAKEDPGTFSPTEPASPPGVGLQLPTIPTLPTGDDAGGAGAAAAGLNFSDFFTDDGGSATDGGSGLLDGLLGL